MATNYVQPGDVISYAHTAEVTSGKVVRIGSLIAIALGDYGANVAGSYAIEGVFSAPKSGDAITAGVRLHWDASASAFGLSGGAAGDLSGAAVAVEAAGTAATTVKVKINPGIGTLTT